MWGCDKIDARGRVIERLIYEGHLGIFNSGTRTHFVMPSGSTSALDLSLASPQLLPLFTWHLADDPLGSDHFPVWLKHDSGTELGARSRRWNMRKAEWHDFSSDVEEQIASEFSGAHEPSVHHFTEVLLGAANRHIPRTSGAPHRIPAPWWTDECRAALRERR